MDVHYNAMWLRESGRIRKRTACLHLQGRTNLKFLLAPFSPLLRLHFDPDDGVGMFPRNI
jgi:hypothetical protein